jgi:arylsulfatase A-like enzyme
MRRRRTLLGALLVAIALGGVLAGPGRAQAAVRPYVLLIVSDEARPETLAVMPKTRRWMSRWSRIYPQAYVTTPLGNPSRSSLMTGRYAHNHLVQNDGSSGTLDASTTTIQAYLHAAGYRTALFGKYLDGWADPRSGISQPRYFDRWASFPGSFAYYDATWRLPGGVRTIHEYSTSYIGDQAVRFIARREADASQPWFMMLGTSAAQSPRTPQLRYRHAPVPRFASNPARAERNRSDKPPYVRARRINPRRDANVRRGQLRTLMSVDDMVDRVFRALRERRELRNTLVVYTSDNGFQWGEHGLTLKGSPYPASYRVPLLIRWPGHFRQAAQTLARRAANIDIAPTVLDAAGVTPDPAVPMDGRSLLRPSTPRAMLLEYWRGGGGGAPPWASIRTATYQYTEYYAADGSVSFREYYVAGDRFQLRNLLHDGDPADNPDVEALHAKLLAARACQGSSC